MSEDPFEELDDSGGAATVIGPGIGPVAPPIVPPPGDPRSGRR